MASYCRQLYIIMQHYMFIRLSPIFASDYASLYATHYTAISFDYVINNWNKNWLTTVVRFAVNGKFFAALGKFFARFVTSLTCNLSPHNIQNYATLCHIIY